MKPHQVFHIYVDYTKKYILSKLYIVIDANLTYKLVK
jgi:hypothetical protein